MRSKTFPPLIFQPCGISIHLLRVEQDDKADFYEVSVWDFNPLASERRDYPHMRQCQHSIHFNPLAPCRARPSNLGRQQRIQNISIHLLRAEQDGHARPFDHRRRHFNPLAPCGARPKLEDFASVAGIFQSTCSVRSKTMSKTA